MCFASSFMFFKYIMQTPFTTHKNTPLSPLLLYPRLVFSCWTYYRLPQPHHDMAPRLRSPRDRIPESRARGRSKKNHRSLQTRSRVNIQGFRYSLMLTTPSYTSLAVAEPPPPTSPPYYPIPPSRATYILTKYLSTSH